MRLARRMRAQRADTMLTLSQLAALATLDRHGAMSPGELAAHEKISPPSTTRLIGVLEATGLVERTAHPTDRRQVMLAVSPAGRGRRKGGRRGRAVWLARPRRASDADALAALDPPGRFLARLAGSWPRPCRLRSAGCGSARTASSRAG